MALNLDLNRDIDMNAGLYAQMQQRINELEQKMAGMAQKPTAKAVKAAPTKGVKRGRVEKCCQPCGLYCESMCSVCKDGALSSDDWPIGCTDESDSDCSESDSEDDGALRKKLINKLKKKDKKTAKKAKKARSGTKEADGICQFRGCDVKSRMFEGHCAAHRCSGGKC